MLRKRSLFVMLSVILLGILSYTIYKAGYAESSLVDLLSRAYLPVVLGESGGPALTSTPVSTLTPLVSATGGPSQTPISATATVTAPSITETATPAGLPTQSHTSTPTGSPTQSHTSTPTGLPTQSHTSTPTSPTQSHTSTPTGLPTQTHTSTPTGSPAQSHTSTPTSPTQTQGPAPTSSPTQTETPTPLPTQTTEAADLVLRNGTIYTVNESQAWAEAVAVREGAIVFVGSNEAVEGFIGAGTQVTELGGRLMLPGMHDVHAHPLEAGSEIITCLLPSQTDPEQMITLIQQCAPNQIGTDWVLGWGYSIGQLLETERAPYEILDEAVPNAPAIMMEETSHSVWVNSMALAAAGIDADSPNPPGGIIMKDPETGEPTGLLLENIGNMMMDLALAPTAELDQLHYEALLRGLNQLARNGITSVSDARAYTSRNFPQIWLRAEQEGTLTARAILGLWAYPDYEDTQQLADLTALYSNDPTRLLRMSQIKLYSDGLLENTTSALLEPYLIDLGIIPGNTGMNYFDESRLTSYITALEEVGFDFHIHTIGDRGVREALDAIESAINTNGDGIERRHRLTHLELIDEVDRPRFEQLGVIADFQVAGDWTLPKYWPDHVPLIGDRALDPIPVRSIYDTGATITLSSDWDVSSLSPFVGMEHSLMRAQQSLPNLDSAVRAYTINGAYAMRQEERTGSIEVGKLADLIVVNQNIFTVPQAQISDTTVLLTLLGGEEVYRAPSFPKQLP